MDLDIKDIEIKLKETIDSCDSFVNQKNEEAVKNV